MKLAVAIITAAASIIVVTLTYFFKLLSDWSDKKRVQKTHLMTLRNELVVNSSISDAIFRGTRTIGFRFIDKAWDSTDTSVIYQKAIPYKDILEAYSGMQVFNLLNERRVLIKEDSSYIGKDQRLDAEYLEMMELNEKIKEKLGKILSEFKVNE